MGLFQSRPKVTRSQVTGVREHFLKFPEWLDRRLPWITFARNGVVTLLLAGAGSLSLVAKPPTLNITNNSHLDLRCSLTPDTSDVSKVMAIQLIKVTGGERRPLASVESGEEGRVDRDFGGKEVKVEGSVSPGRPREAFLQFSVQNPDASYVGGYVCVMSYLDHSAFLLSHNETKVTVSSFTPASTIEGQNSPHGSNLSAQVVEELQRLRDHVANLTHQLQSVQPLTASASSPVAFSTRPSSTDFYHKGPLTFDNVTLNRGQGYNSSTGCFRAPVSGVYVFVAAVSVDTAKTLVELKVNGTTKAQLAVNGDDQSSVSVTVELQAGDLVWLESVFSSSNSTRIYADTDSVFFGFLLQGN